MKVTATALPGVLLVEPQLFSDERGQLHESFNERRFLEHGLPGTFRQDNLSRSRRGVLRGLHYQLRQPQGKLVTAVQGEIFDVAVDIRRGSPTFGQAFTVRLSEASPRSLWVPPGFAHGFCVLSETATVAYKCTAMYAPDDDHGVLWSDPDLGIPWPVTDPVLSPKDRQYLRLNSARTDLPEYRA